MHKLVPDIDVVVINYRPDVAARLRSRLRHACVRIRPDLIYVDNTAFGRQGPWAQRPGYDIVAQAVTGLMALDGKLDDNGTAPAPVSSPVADYGTGIVIALGVCAALFHRQQTGKGQMVETTLLNTALAMQGSSVMQLPLADELPAAKMARINELRAEGAPYAELQDVYKDRGAQGALNIYYRCYETRDGAVAIGALSASLWAKVRDALETDFLGFADPNLDATDPEQLARAAASVREVEAHVRSQTTEYWLERFEAHGVPSGPIQFPEELANDPQIDGQRHGRRSQPRPVRPSAPGRSIAQDERHTNSRPGFIATPRPRHRRHRRQRRLQRRRTR